jgi:hypothetical protein
LISPGDLKGTMIDFADPFPMPVNKGYFNGCETFEKCYKSLNIVITAEAGI